MKQKIKKCLMRFRDFLNKQTAEQLSMFANADAVAQCQLALSYTQRLADGKSLPAFRDTGFKRYSQTDEDGLLLFIFAIIGSTNKVAVEICAGNGIECNAANLIINHGWHGVLFDGNIDAVNQGRLFYSQNRATYVYPPRFVHAWITKDNINQLIEESGVRGGIDLLSMDMDGVDYWILNSLTVIDPRVIVLEYQDIIGPERALTVPYSENFDGYAGPTMDGMPNFSGASLAAFGKLLHARGYRLVGCNRLGYNAFFVKNGLGEDSLPECGIKDCFTHPKVVQGMKERFPTVASHPWVEV